MGYGSFGCGNCACFQSLASNVSSLEIWRIKLLHDLRLGLADMCFDFIAGIISILERW